MKLGLDFDISRLISNLDAQGKNLAYSTAQALNDTAKEAQADERERVQQVFTVRNPQFILRLIKIGQFASVKSNRPFVDIFIDQRPLKSKVLLPIFERGGEKTSDFGGNVAVPITGGPARPTFATPVAPRWRVPALRFVKGKESLNKKIGVLPHAAAIQKANSSGAVWKGRLGTYLIPNVGIFQRVGNKSVLVYTFKKSVRLDNRLQFGATVEKTFNAVYRDNFERIFLLRSRSLPK